jgi:hypothetical protein
MASEGHTGALRHFVQAPEANIVTVARMLWSWIPQANDQEA